MTSSGSKSRRFNGRGGEPEIVLLVVVVVVVLMGASHCLRIATPAVCDGVADGRTKPKDEEGKPLLLQLLVLVLLTIPERTSHPLVLRVLNICKPGVRRPPAAAAAIITNGAQCKSRQKLRPLRGRKVLL